MEIPREFTTDVIDTILPKGRYNPKGTSRLRTPLHVDFPKDTDEHISPAERTDIHYKVKTFNAVGSRFENGSKAHYPVIDVDGGAYVQTVGAKAKAVIKASYDAEKFDPYSPKSMLRDILGDNGIDLEVFDVPELRHSQMTGRTRFIGKRVTALVLRAEDRSTFAVADSTQEGHSHLYIQSEFSDFDHTSLISELWSLGIVSERWQQIVEQEGMGIVRAPWTYKDITDRPS